MLPSIIFSVNFVRYKDLYITSPIHSITVFFQTCTYQTFCSTYTHVHLYVLQTCDVVRSCKWRFILNLFEVISSVKTLLGSADLKQLSQLFIFCFSQKFQVDYSAKFQSNFLFKVIFSMPHYVLYDILIFVCYCYLDVYKIVV